MIDVDHFKRFNDRYGHLLGDECLRNLGRIIQENIRRPGDLAARFGGEDFAVVLPSTDYVGAFIVAEKFATLTCSRTSIIKTAVWAS